MTEFQEALTEVLVCPLTKQQLRPLEERELLVFNERIAAGEMRAESDTGIAEALSAGLITADAKRIYRIKSGIAVMLGEESLLIPT